MKKIFIFFALLLASFQVYSQNPSCKSIIGLNNIKDAKQTIILENNETITFSSDSIRKYDINYKLKFKTASDTITQVRSYKNKLYTMGSSDPVNKRFIKIYDKNNTVLNIIKISKDVGTTRLSGLNFFDTDNTGNLYIFSTSYKYAVGWYYNLYKFNEDGAFIWKKEFNTRAATSGNLWLSEDFDFDSSGNLYISGMFYDTLTLDSFSINGGNDNNAKYLLLLKLDINGNVINLLKKHYWNGVGPISTKVIDHDIYVIGSYYLSTTSGDLYKGSIQKFDNSFSLIWQEFITQPVDNYNVLMTDVFFNHDEILIVGTGRISGILNFNNAINLPGGSYIASYDLDGNVNYVKPVNGGIGLTNFVKDDTVYLYGNTNSKVEIDNQSLEHNGFFIAELSKGAIFDEIDFYNQGTTANSLNPNNYLNKDIPIRFKVKVKNELAQNLSTLKGTITTDTPGVTILNNSVNFGNIISNTSGWSTNEFEIQVDDTVPSGTLLEFQLSTEDQIISGGPWISNFSFPIEPLTNGDLILVENTGNGNNKAEPGETLKLFPRISNSSASTIANVSAVLATQDPLNITSNNKRYNVVANVFKPFQPTDVAILPELPFEFNYPQKEALQELNFDLEVQGNLNDSNGVLLKWKNTIVLNEGEDPVIPPKITNYLPLNNAIDVAIETNLVLDFDKNITAVSGKFINLYTANNTLEKSIEVTDVMVSVVNNKANINLNSNLQSGTNYYVLIDDGAFIDQNNTNFEGITDTSTWNFTTIQNNPPDATVVSVASVTSSEIEITWDAVDTATSYQILSCDQSFTYATSITGTSYTVTGLSESTSYNFVVKAMNNIGASQASNCVTAETLCKHSWGNYVPTGGSSTTAYCVVTIDNEPATANDLVGVFVEGELKGMGTVVISSGTAYSTIIIDGSVPETATFKVWDASNCEELSVAYSIQTNQGELGLPPNFLPINAQKSTASINKVEINNQIQLYPNPTKNTLNIKTDNNININKIVVYNVLGKVVKIEKEVNTRIELQNLSKGTYIMKLFTNKGIGIKRIVKQ